MKGDLGAGPFLFAGGGTGGHLFPGLAVAEALRGRSPGCQIVFAGSERALDRQIVGDHGFEFVSLPSESLAILKRRPWRFASGLCRSVFAARRLFAGLQPAVVIGLGGFASAPVVWTALRWGIPIVLLEQNVIPGRATRWFGRSAARICCSFSETIPRLSTSLRPRTVVTGNPVRRSLVEATHGASESASSECPPTLLVLGGSQGSHSVNQAMTAAARSLGDALLGWRIVHQTGVADVAAVQHAYRELGLLADVAAFFPDLPDRCQAARLAVSRAGATTLAELACAGLPAVLIPFPHAADDHQRANAEWFAESGAAVMLLESSTPGDDTATRLAEPLGRLIRDPEAVRAMRAAMHRTARPEAAERVADVITAHVPNRPRI